MTRRKWTTPPQEIWLKERLSAFTDSQADKTTSTHFFPDILKEWRKSWPLQEPTNEEVAAAGSPEEATKAKKDKEDEVRECPWCKMYT